MTNSDYSCSIVPAANPRAPTNPVHVSASRRGEGMGEPASRPVHPPVASPAAFRVLVTVVEAANMLSIARSHLYVQLQRGQLPSVLIGRSRRILVRDLEAYAEGLRETGF